VGNNTRTTEPGRATKKGGYILDISASTRRSFVAALLGMGLLGGRPLSGPLWAAPESPLPLPDRPMRLTRVLTRALGEGRSPAITVRRWWDVAFERQGRGIVVSGRQTGAEVDAPAKLAEIARIEQQRDASGMLPLMLSDRGAIIPLPGVPSESDAVSAALRVAESMIARQPIPAEERARISHYLAEVHRAGSGVLNALPGDLLFPAGVPISQSETVALPDGITGEFAFTYAAATQPDAPWLARAERRVVTRVAGSERQAAETWNLEPI